MTGNSSFLGKASLALLAFSSLCTGKNVSSPYNILSLDGGGIRGIITAQVVQYMENYGY